jgi:hypothetical protein
MAKMGGLIAYGRGRNQMYRQLARLVAKVLHGAKAADVPVEQPTQIDFVINLKTAKVLGLEVPRTLLAIADEVIEYVAGLLRLLMAAVGTNATNRLVRSNVCFRGQERTRYARFEFFVS